MEQLSFAEFVVLLKGLRVLEETTRKEAIESYHKDGADLRPAMQELERISNLKHKVVEMSKPAMRS